MLVWVTSFNQAIFHASGQEMVRTFVTTRTEGTLHVHPESVVLPRPPGRGEYSPQVHWAAEIASDPQLAAWLRANAAVIPKDLGGSWRGPCRCKNASNPHAKTHKLPCPGYWFCRHASRWYRKMIALRRTLETFPGFGAGIPDLKIVWVDADVVFNTQVTEERVTSWFRGTDAFYLKGPKRAEWETGVVGFSGPNGVRYLRTVFDRFTTGAFRKDPRWDDCYQLRMALKTMPDVTAVDLATDASGHSDVVPHSPLGEVLEHKKGIHSRVKKIFK